MHERNQDNFFPTFIKLFVCVLSNQSFEWFDTCFYSDTKIFFVKSTLYIMTIKHHIHLASDLCTNRYSSDGKMMFKIRRGKKFLRRMG